MIESNNLEHGHAIAQASGGHYNPAVDVVLSRTSHAGKLLGGVIYQGYTRQSICVHMAGFIPNWINRDLLWISFQYPFVQLGCNKMFGQIPSTNMRSLALSTRLGFREVTRIDGVFPDGDLVVMEMNKSECRWLDLRKPRDTSLDEPQGTSTSGP